MIEKIINFSIHNKLIVILFTLTVAGFGVYSILNIPIGAVPDITNNQVQVITTSGNLSTQEIEQFITAPVELEMANLPGVQEIRSVSKFGLSVVTIVFDDKIGTYLPRQLIAEKIKSASANIPEGFGTPEMGPITTGLGEIYQYILDVKPEFKDKYTPMELRTIQDWIVKRQLSGIKGVVEVNSWGGYLKQYEVAVDPQKLRSLDITIVDVFNALKDNNSVSGGSYIEKTNQAYFIRGDGMVKSLDDIRNIVIESKDGVPVFMKDVADIRFGYANRYGAITANGEGEKVMGQIMMLKDANSKQVIKAVKERVAHVQKSLPEGVYINPVLERSELIGKTSFTITENLLLGFVIVVITVFLLLGNVRSALVIASMIPLALLFTLSMMYIFGIDANLMSLGALDFGIIIDGAVIIVEFIMLKLGMERVFLEKATKTERRSIMDKVTFTGATGMMNSAVFGQIIILIVFIPILSLSGVEGKMFRPMALAFSFAIIGAMIFGFTWLPVASSLFLRPPKEERKTIADRIMHFANYTYTPVIEWSYNNKRKVLMAALVSLVVTGVIFSNMGGEFVPTLDEGDFVIQPVLKTGTSLSKTVATTTQMEKILIDSFPNEVDQIVCRIGAAEVPTDPMSMEEIDMIIKLHPRDGWKVAHTKDELAERFKEALAIIPGIEYEFTQPIEMRFNELITGVRADIAVKIFGEDLDYMNKKAIEIKKLIEGVPGAADVILEKTAGLPQMSVVYNRDKIAYYGLNTSMLNKYLAIAFGGEVVGSVFEGEKRFGLVLRLHSGFRKDIDNIKNLNIPLANGRQVPLKELAEIKYTTGPAKISRENTHRRVVVSVNVRNRDLQSVVEDIQRVVNKNIHLKPGNYITYGGQFENLQNATKRLTFAVPLALLLIFIFLHFAFKSMKDAFMIFTAIPLSTVGGVFALWLRGMPFSVSAGIGFIALFGIAVLNGIVLIEHLKDLQKQGIHDMRELIFKGTKDRLRPVMLTAAAAATGFLPMAISHGAGAEVQRPLATVVIGGLVTSTMLTMIALPLLFSIFNNPKYMRNPFKKMKTSVVSLLLIVITVLSFAGCSQPESSDVQEAKSSENLLQLTKKQIKVNNIEFGKVTKVAFDSVVECSGYVEASPQGRAIVGVQMSGVVKSINIRKGTYVKKGAVLCELSSNEFITIQREFAEAAARLPGLKAEYDRNKTLFEQNVGSGKSYLEAESTYKALLAKYKALEIQFVNMGLSPDKIKKSDYYSLFPVFASVSGRITDIFVNIGQYAEKQQQVAEILDFNTLQLSLAVFENDVEVIKKGQKVEFKTVNSSSVTFYGTVSAITGNIDEESRTIECIATIDNDKSRLVNNAYVNANIVVKSNTYSALPEQAIVHTETGDYILELVNDTETGNFIFKKTVVKTGKSQGGYTQLLNPNISGKVLVKGIYNLQIE